MDDQWFYGGPDGGSFSMLHGHIQTPRGVEKVQLIIGCHGSGNQSCMSFIKSFYASHVQCFVGGRCAGHMYYYQAKKRESTLWEPQPYQQINKVNLAVQKYQTRGYIFTPARTPTRPLVHTFNDEPAFLVDYKDFYRQFISPLRYNILSLWLEERRVNL